MTPVDDRRREWYRDQVDLFTPRNRWRPKRLHEPLTLTLSSDEAARLAAHFGRLALTVGEANAMTDDAQAIFDDVRTLVDCDLDYGDAQTIGANIHRGLTALVSRLTTVQQERDALRVGITHLHAWSSDEIKSRRVVLVEDLERLLKGSL